MRFASLGLLLVVLSSSPAIAENNSVRARLTPQQEAKLSSQMDGRILQYYVDAGESFAQGQKLIEFDCSEQQARLKVSQAQRSIADETYNTQRRLQSLQAVSELEVAVAKAELDKALAEVELNQVAIQRCQILAPYPGRVVQRLANSFENVAYGADLLEVVDTQPLWIDLYVPSQWLRWLTIGHDFSLTLDETGQRYAAQVQRLGTRVDSVSQTITVRGIFSDPKQSGLLPGMSGRADFNME